MVVSKMVRMFIACNCEGSYVVNEVGQSLILGQPWDDFPNMTSVLLVLTNSTPTQLGEDSLRTRTTATRFLLVKMLQIF